GPAQILGAPGCPCDRQEALGERHVLRAELGLGLRAASRAHTVASSRPGRALRMIEPVGYLIVGLFGIGMGLAFLVADPEAPTSRSLAFFWVLIGVVFLLNIPSAQVLPRLAMLQFFSTAEALIVATGLEWAFRVMRAQDVDDDERCAARFWVRAGQMSAALYAIVGFSLPVLQSQVWKVAWHTEQLRRPAFYLFAVPFFSSL